MVMGDEFNEFTTILNRAYSPIKDNRIPPIGFTTTNEAYDTTEIVGAALSDFNFNHENGGEGSGSDMVYYNVAINNYLGTLYGTVRVYYQTIHPRWLNNMFGDETPEINLFKQMVETSNPSPVFVSEASINDEISDDINELTNNSDWIIVNQSFTRKDITVDLKENATVMLYDINGRQLSKQSFSVGTNRIKQPSVSGIILLVAISENEEYFVKKLHVLNK